MVCEGTIALHSDRLDHWVVTRARLAFTTTSRGDYPYKDASAWLLRGCGFARKRVWAGRLATSGRMSFDTLARLRAITIVLQKQRVLI